jgi:hypothetical protein
LAWSLIYQANKWLRPILPAARNHAGGNYTKFVDIKQWKIKVNTIRGGLKLNCKKATIIVLLFFSLIISGCNQTTQTTTLPKYVGSINSNKYHYPDCEWAQKILPENEIWFDTEAEAEEAGYRPCKVCRP